MNDKVFSQLRRNLRQIGKIPATAETGELEEPPPIPPGICNTPLHHATMLNSTSPLGQAIDSLVLPLNTPFYHTSRLAFIPGIPDKILALLSPIVAYWIPSLFFHLLDTRSQSPPFSWLNVDQYRLHEPAEVKKRNRCTPQEVFRAIIVQQVVQTALGYWWITDDDLAHSKVDSSMDHIRGMRALAPFLGRTMAFLFGESAAARLLSSYGGMLLHFAYWWAIPAIQFVWAFFVIDTWQYFMHRLFHINKFLYKHFHSVHHRLYVPYAYGALYNHPLEGFLLDSIGAVLAESLALLTTRQTALLFAFSAAKTVDDHCGFALPWDPLQLLYRNNASYHDVHHQTYGLKYNFSQPFFIHWDIVLGTRWNKPPKSDKNTPIATSDQANDNSPGVHKED